MNLGSQRVRQGLWIAEALLAMEPKILGFGVYIWNVEQTTEVVALMKRIRPGLIIILGGPEVSYETEGQEIVARHYYRPRDPEVAAKYSNTFPRVNLVTIADFGGWKTVNARHFAEGAAFDRIYLRK